MNTGTVRKIKISVENLLPSCKSCLLYNSSSVRTSTDGMELYNERYP